jgi:hypothetical protein
MVSEHCVEEMLIQARKMLKDTSWFHFAQRSLLEGWILACETILEEK